MHKAAATTLGGGCWGQRALTLVMVLCSTDLCLEPSTCSYGDTTVAGVTRLHGRAALTTEHMVFAGHFPQGKFQNFSLAFPSRDGGNDASGRAAIQGTSAGSVVERAVYNQLR